MTAPPLIHLELNDYQALCQINLYAVGFLFDPERENVLLIRKKRPDWQRGYYNGVGGKHEKGESHLECMIREFREETGLVGLDWRPEATLHQKCRPWWHYEKGTWVSNIEPYQVGVFSAVSPFIHLARQETDETLHIVPVANLRNEKTVPNVPLLVALALCPSEFRRPVEFTYPSPTPPNKDQSDA